MTDDLLISILVPPESEKRLTPVKPPSAPGVPAAEKIRSESVVLSWQASGSENVRYVIQRRSKRNEKWKVAKTKAFISSTKTTVRNLKNETKYYFRVVPYIKKVEGTPSGSSEEIVTGNPFGKSNYFA